jgi:hydrogenase/urease accessory protein HupE
VLGDRLQVEFNLDLQTLQAFAAVDLDHNGEVERTEFEKNRPLYEQLLQEKLRLTFQDRTDSRLVPLNAEWQSPANRIPASELRNAHVQFTLECPFIDTVRGPFRLQPQVFDALGANHRIILGVVEGETSEQAVLTITEPAIEYAPRHARESKETGTFTGDTRPPRGASSGSIPLFILGVEHILSGYDHLLFLLALLLAAQSWRHVLACVSAFTAAHSLTLALAALGWVQLPDRWVESAIAASIAWVALRNLLAGDHPPDWKQTLLFGLVHGFGFAALFRELKLPQSEFLRGILAFNLGVEAGQIAILLPLVPALLAIRNRVWGIRLRKTLSFAALLLALLWFVERVRAPLLSPE